MTPTLVTAAHAHAAETLNALADSHRRAAMTAPNETAAEAHHQHADRLEARAHQASVRAQRAEVA